MAEPTFDDIEALVGPATPHFAFQIRARVRELIAGLPAGRPGAAARRGEDPPARRPRPRLVEGRGRRARGAAHPDRLGRDPVVGARRTASPAHGLRSTALMGRSVLVTGGSRGIGKAIALRLARDGATRVAIGYMRSDAAAEETAAELRALGAEPVLVRGNVTSDRVLEQIRELGPLDVFVHNAATGVIRPALETEDKHWDWTLNANARAFLALTRVDRPGDARRLVGRRDLEPRLDPRARELRPRRHLEGRARGARALPRGRARPGGDPRQRRLGRRRRHGRARPLPEPRGDARAGLSQRGRADGHTRGHGRRPSRSSARPTRRWCAARH